uniref:E-selectin-like n=1 Tax=Phallusia mammillata TaxID=59560 RepID=A0A6F9DSF5_9ASCI|nr:E-selectin-like [Phallusia mammillata]
MMMKICCLMKVKLTKIHIVEVFIDKIKADHETVIWKVNKNPYQINLNAIDVEVTPNSETWATNFFGSLYQARFLLNQNFKSASWLLGTNQCTVDCKTNNTLSNSELNHFKCSCIISGELCYSQLTTKTHLHSIFNNTEVKSQTNNSAWKKVVHISDCGNVTFPGVVQDVPVNKGYLSTHTFSCIQPFYLPASAVAVHQSDAIWNVTSFCIKVPVCNYPDIPSNDLYQQPTSGTAYYPNSTTLTCNQRYFGTVTAQCSKHGTWNISHNCTAKSPSVEYIVGITLIVQVVGFVVICLIYYKMNESDDFGAQVVSYVDLLQTKSLLEQKRQKSNL